MAKNITTTLTADAQKTLILNGIAKDILRLDTLETRNSDSLDFHDTAVWTIKEALELAFAAGARAAARASR